MQANEGDPRAARKHVPHARRVIAVCGLLLLLAITILALAGARQAVLGENSRGCDGGGSAAGSRC